MEYTKEKFAIEMDAQALSNRMRKMEVAPAIQEILHAPIALQIINIAQNVIGMQMNIKQK